MSDIKIILHSPKDDENKKALAEKVAKVHAEAVLYLLKNRVQKKEVRLSLLKKLVAHCVNAVKILTVK